MKHPHLALMSILFLSLGTPAKAISADSFNLPDCDHGSVLSKVNHTLAIAEKNVVRSGDPVTSISYVRQSKLRKYGPRYVAQRYCRATGLTERGRKKRIYFLIEADAGFIGYGYNVEACIPDRDPWKVHGAYCRSLR